MPHTYFLLFLLLAFKMYLTKPFQYPSINL